MKRCPECRRDYFDDSLQYCLEDGAALIQGSVPSPDEPATVILHETAAPGEAATRAQIHTTERTAVLPSGITDVPRAKGFDKRLLAAPLLLAVVVLGGFLGYRYLGSNSKQIESVAVLPFENRSGNTDADYISDGLADSLIYRLSQIPNLKVSPTNSVMRYKGKEADFANVAKELNVDAVMSGRLMQRGDDLSISVQLVDLRTNKLIWAEQYERKMADLLATQREIAASIADKLQLKLSGSDSTGITKKYTNDNEAYQLYLKGRFNWNKRTDAGLKAAIDNYEHAIERDPGFALAYSGLADTYVIIGAYGSIPPNESMPKAKAAAIRALELDSTLAEPHAAIGAYYAGYGWNLEKAEQEFRKAIELNPNYATGWHWLGNFLPEVGKSDEAIAAGKRAEEIDPLSAIISGDTGYDMILARRYDDALEQAKHTLTIDQNFWYGYYVMAIAYELKGMPDKALEPAQKAVELSPGPITNGRLASILAKAGQRDAAKHLVDGLTGNSDKTYVQGYYLATAQLALGERDAAFQSLERDLRERGIYMQWLAVNPEFDPLKNDPRFVDLLKRMEASKLD
jgi:TolB-like protein